MITIYPKRHLHQADKIYTACSSHSRVSLAPRRTENPKMVTCLNCLRSRELKKRVKELANGC